MKIATTTAAAQQQFLFTIFWRRLLANRTMTHSGCSALLSMSTFVVVVALHFEHFTAFKHTHTAKLINTLSANDDEQKRQRVYRKCKTNRERLKTCWTYLFLRFLFLNFKTFFLFSNLNAMMSGREKYQASIFTFLFLLLLLLHVWNLWNLKLSSLIWSAAAAQRKGKGTMGKHNWPSVLLYTVLSSSSSSSSLLLSLHLQLLLL